MIKKNENSFYEGFEPGEKNLVFQLVPGAGQTPQQAPAQTPPTVPATPALRTEIESGAKEKLHEFESDFSINAIDISRTVDDTGQKYNFDNWCTAQGDNPQANKVYAEIDKVCKDSCRNVDTLILALKNPGTEVHTQAVKTLERCVAKLREKEEIIAKSKTDIEDLHDVPEAKQLSDWTKNAFSFYNQQDTPGKIAVIFSVGWILKMATDKDTLEKESPFGCTWKTLRNMGLLAFAGNYLVAAVRDDHEAPIQLGGGNKLENVPPAVRSIITEASQKDPNQIAALGTLCMFDSRDMEDWYNLYKNSPSQSINPEQSPFNFYKLTPKGETQRGRDLWRMMHIMVTKAGGTGDDGVDKFKKKYIDNPNRAWDFMSIAEDLKLVGRPSAITSPEDARKKKELVTEHLFPVLEKEGPLGDFDPKLNDSCTVLYLKSVPVEFVALEEPAKGDDKKKAYSFRLIVRGESMAVDPNDKNALKGQLGVLDGLLKKDIKERMATHPGLEGKEPYWAASGYWAVKNVKIEGSTHEKVYLRAHDTDPNLLWIRYGKREILWGTRSMESNERNGVYEDYVRSYPGGAFAGMDVVVGSVKANGDKVLLTGTIEGIDFKAEYNETTQKIKMIDFNYDAPRFINEKRRYAADTIFPKGAFDKLGNLADLAPEKSYIKDSVDEAYWKGLVSFKHYEALNLYAEYVQRAKTPGDLVKADRRLQLVYKEFEAFAEGIEKQVNDPEAEISKADFEGWIQGLDNLDYWYGNPGYKDFMLKVRTELEKQDFEGMGEEEYKVFNLVYREVSDATALFSLLNREFNTYEKAYLEYVFEQVLGLSRKSDYHKEDFEFSLDGVKNLLDYVDESVKVEDVRRFLDIKSYQTWAKDHPGALSASSDILSITSVVKPDEKTPERLPDGRLTERGAYIGVKGRYEAIEKTAEAMKVTKADFTDYGKFETELLGIIKERYNDAKRVAGLDSVPKQNDELKKYVRDLLAIYKKYLKPGKYTELEKKLPSNLER